MAEALVHLHPAPPAAPSALMAPDDLAATLEVADMCDGVPPHCIATTGAKRTQRASATPMHDDDKAELR